MPNGLHIVEDLRDLAVRSNNESHARDALKDPSVHALFLDYSKSCGDLFLFVGEQGVG